jgi:mono/diheme cytochrome c family protein
MSTVSVRRLACWLLPLACCALTACQQQMAAQPSYRPDRTSSFFPNGRVDQPLVRGTVARGHLHTDLELFAGLTGRPKPVNAGAAKNEEKPGETNKNDKADAQRRADLGGIPEVNLVDRFPFPITKEILQHGQDRYMIYCIVCHDAEGTGQGKIVERGYTPPPSYHIERLRKEPIGHFFRVMTDGYGSMPDYKQQLPVRDRWAIAAYIRALQLSQHFPEGEVTDAMRKEWEGKKTISTAEEAP